MRSSSVASSWLVALVVFLLGVSACDDGDSNKEADVLTADSQTQDLDEPDVQEELSSCEDVECLPALAIAGHYNDEWGGHHEITSEVWTQSGFGEVSQFLISEYSNVARWLVAQNGPDNAWNPDLFSRFDWTWFDDGTGEALWFCQTIFDAESEEAALKTEAADATDPSVGGCAGFTWTKLTPAAE